MSLAAAGKVRRDLAYDLAMTMVNTISPPVEPEPEIDPTDPYAREAQTFPRLSVDAANRVANYGVEQGLRKGTLLF